MLLATASSASGQYFGGNKVQYRTFRFQVLKTSHFDVFFYPEERDAAAQAARMAERWYARLATLLKHQLSGRQPLVLYASHTDFEQTNIIEGTIGEGTGGVTEMFKRRIVLPVGATMADTDHVIGHELVHAFQYDVDRQVGRSRTSGTGGMQRLPLWFVEGMAEYLSVGPTDPHTAMWIRDAAGAEQLPTIRQLDDPRFFPYRWGQAFWAYVAGRWGDAIMAPMLDAAIRAGDAEIAIQGVLAIAPDDLTRAWHSAIRAAYEPVAAATQPASTLGRRLPSAAPPPGGLVVAPALSPDGSRIVYFAERDLVSIDLVVADAQTGDVIRSLVRTAFDPHLDSLQFINSGGSWSSDGRQFIFGAIRNGQPELVLYDMERYRILRQIPLPDLSEILTPSLSPNGRLAAFSGLAGGFSDLYIYDLEAGALRQVTQDPFGDLQPAWSPDGQRVAFVTERFGGDVARVTPGNYRLAMFDLPSGAVQAVPTFSGSKSINPAWTPDGRSRVFLADPTGITNMYAVNMTGGGVRQLTNLRTGISGITALSPALTIASASGAVAVTAYEKGGMNSTSRKHSMRRDRVDRSSRRLRSCRPSLAKAETCSSCAETSTSACPNLMARSCRIAHGCRWTTSVNPPSVRDSTQSEPSWAAG